MYKEQRQQQQQQHRVKGWESTVRKSQQQQLTSNRRRFFSPMPVAPADDDADTATTASADNLSTADEEEGNGAEDEDEELYQAERVLANGDVYSGQWSGSLPQGTGRYVWSDGCSYEGQWRRGKINGHGKFSWPSGATFEGEIKAGFMDGFGTYTGTSGDTYRGLWSMNLKHGRGSKSYANGDFYAGEWRAGLQDGHGRYVWRNGTEYVGQWRAGLIHGCGALTWANGNHYDGGWENGYPQGSGSFRWADGGLYVGEWTKDSNDEIQQKGVYYPSPAATSPTARDPLKEFSADLRECKITPSEAFSILPSQKILQLSGSTSLSRNHQRRWVSTDNSASGLPPKRPNGRMPSVVGTNDNGGAEKSYDRICIWETDGDITCEFVDNRSSVGGRESMEESTRGSWSDDGQARMGTPIGTPRSTPMATPRARWTPPPKAKKQGETICKGHKNYDLMLNLQLGIRHAVGKQGPINLDLKSSAFDPKEKVWTRFPPSGSKHTPPHQSSDFKWKDYCPLVFSQPDREVPTPRTLRKLFKVDAADYMISLCGNDALRELSSPGKSGSFFYLTNDDRYMIKTMKKAEVKVLLRMLPAYYKHVCAFDNTLVTKFFGLHCVKLAGSAQKKVRFVIMGNLFCSDYPINRRFDLKGSSLGRMTRKPESEIDEYTTLKDLDLNFIFRLQRPWFQEFQRQVDKDCEFLEQERIMDYSLLVGVHFRSLSSAFAEGKGDNNMVQEATPRLSRVDMDQFFSEQNLSPAIRLGINMPARAELTVRKSDSDQLIGEPTGEFYEVILFFGIIDILQDYDISKKLEHAYKSVQYDPTSISAVDPRQYSRRFRDFIFRAYMEDT